MTAGIFTVLLGLVSVGAANAAVVSTEYLEQKLESKQNNLSATGPVKIENDVVSVETGAISENGTNLVTAGDIYTAVNAAVANMQTTTNLVTSTQAVANRTAEDKYLSVAGTDALINDSLGALTGNVDKLTTTVSGLDTDMKNVKGDILDINNETTGILAQSKSYTDTAVQGLTDGAVATNTAAISVINGADTVDGSMAKMKKDLQATIDLKADKADVTGVTYSGTNYLDEQTGLKAATIKLDAQVKANADTIAVLDTAGGGEGVKGLIDDVNANKAAITKLNETAATVGSVANSIETALDGLDLADTATSGQFVTSVSQENGVITVTRAALASSDIPVIAISQVDGLQAALDAKQVKLTSTDGVIVLDANGNVSIAAKSIQTGMIADSAITTDKINNGAVTSDKLGENAVTAGKIAADAVTQGTIADGAVVAGNLAENAVTAGTIAAGAVTNATINDGELSVAKINGLTTTLDKKFEVPAYETRTEDGMYVLTATQKDGAVTYAWENIAGRAE